MTGNPLTANRPMTTGGHLALVLATWLRSGESLTAPGGDLPRLTTEVW